MSGAIHRRRYGAVPASQPPTGLLASLRDPARNAQLPTPNAFALNKRVSRKDNLFQHRNIHTLSCSVTAYCVWITLDSSNAYSAKYGKATLSRRGRYDSGRSGIGECNIGFAP